MQMQEFLLIALCVLSVAMLALLLLVAKRLRDTQDRLAELEESKADLRVEQQALRSELAESTQRSMRGLGDMLGERQELTRRTVADMSAMMEKRLSSFAMENEQKLENIRATMEKRVAFMQEDNNKRLDEMRGIVDEKLQKTLNARMTESFQLVNERLEQVYKGLGEMQSLAVGVGDLKKTLSGVKTRGILGEIQLGAILQEILAPEQYEMNFMVNHKPVEFAVKLPGDGGEPVYLPIDSKFPLDAYANLMEAYENGTPEAVKAATALLRGRVQGFAKDIHAKYINPPYTTDFAIMFLPTEGLYAEVVRLGLFEQLQRDYRVSIAGPSTMAAILNSFQMGFRSIAVQKRSGEVWKVLGAVKTEFDKFQDVLVKAQDKLTRVNSDLDTLITTRTRKIQRSLKEVEALPVEEAARYLPGAQEITEGADADEA